MSHISNCPLCCLNSFANLYKTHSGNVIPACPALLIIHVYQNERRSRQRIFQHTNITFHTNYRHSLIWVQQSAKHFLIFLVIPDFSWLWAIPYFFWISSEKLLITNDFQLFTLKKLCWNNNSVDFEEWSLNNCKIIFCWCTRFRWWLYKCHLM